MVLFRKKALFREAVITDFGSENRVKILAQQTVSQGSE